MSVSVGRVPHALEAQFTQGETQWADAGETALRKAQAKKTRHPSPSGTGEMHKKYADHYSQPYDNVYDLID